MGDQNEQTVGKTPLAPTYPNTDNNTPPPLIDVVFDDLIVPTVPPYLFSASLGGCVSFD